MPEERAVLVTRMPAELKARLERAAEAEDLKVAQLLRRIVREWLERHEADTARA